MSTGFLQEYLERSKIQNQDNGDNSLLPVRLPHSLSQKDEEAAKFVIAQSKVEPPSEEMLEILPNICNCLFGLCGFGCGLDLCAILPRLCSFLAGLCGSLNDSGISSGQNYSPLTVQVLLAIKSIILLINLRQVFLENEAMLANCIQQNIQDCRSEKVIVKENTVFVNREHTMVKKPSLDENTELILPLLRQGEEKVAVQSCTTYNLQQVSSSSSSSSSAGGSPSPKSSSVQQGFFLSPSFQVHSGPSTLPAVTSTHSSVPCIEGPTSSALVHVS